MKKEKKERKPMKEWAKITLIVTTSVLGFFVFTFVVTFLGGELPWTAHRSSAIFVEEYPVYAGRYGDFGGYGQKIYFDTEDSQKRQEQFDEIFWELFELGDWFGVPVQSGGIANDRWLCIGCLEEDVFLARGIFNLYAKWYDVPIFLEIGGPNVFQ